MNLLDSDDEFIKIDSAICEFDSVGYAPVRAGEGSFQWAFVETGCLALLERARDVRVGIWYLRACIARRGVIGFAEGLRLLADLMCCPLEILYPRGLPGESPGETIAIHLGWLSGDQFLHQLRNAKFEDLDASLGEIGSGRGLIIVSDSNIFENAINIANDIQKYILKIAESVSDFGQELDISRTIHVLSMTVTKLAQMRASTDDVGNVTSGCEKGGRVLGAPEIDSSRMAINSGNILRSRGDVGTAIERIVEYFRSYEPSHPAPIFLARIQRMLGAGFEDVMAELFPEAESLVAKLGRAQSSTK
nr:type VI secretion system ImpA family N-terminal domain-containing protein [Burkholderia ubonensis]